MKKITTLILLLISNFSLFIVNAQNIYFNKRIDITGSGEVCRGVVLAKGGYLVAGGTGDDITKIYLSHIDSLGNLKWTQYYNNTNYLYYLGLSGSLIATHDKNNAIFGSRTDINNHSWGLIIKVDSSGNKIWERNYETVGISHNTNSGIQTKDNGFIYTGVIWDGKMKSKYLLLKTDSLGNQQWYKTYTDNDPNRNYAGNCVIQTPDNGYCIGGEGGSWIIPYYHSIVEIIKTDSLGNQQWKKTFGNPLNSNWGTMLSISNDTCIIASYSIANSSIPENNRQIYIAKFELNGNERWNKKIGNAAPGNETSWVQTKDDGSIIISGRNMNIDTTSKSLSWLFKLNNNGDSSWYREYTIINGPNDANQLWQFTPTPDNGFACAGSLFPFSAGGTQDIWLFKTDSLGCLVPNCTGIGITEFNPNAGVQMLIYPNPFKEAFAINYNIPKDNKNGVFELRDLLGKLVYSIKLSNNVNQLQVIAKNLKSGIYVAYLSIDGVMVSSQKIIKNE